MLGLEVRDCALDLAAEPAVHGQDLIEILPCYPEYLERHPARARDEIERIDGIHVIRIHESDLEHPFGNTEGHERIVSRRLLGNILEDLIRDLRISKRAHGHIARSLGSARGRRYGSLCGHTTLAVRGGERCSCACARVRPGGKRCKRIWSADRLLDNLFLEVPQPHECRRGEDSTVEL